MTDLFLAAGLFVATHAIPAARPVRNALIGLLGERPYTVLYSFLSLAVIVWLGLAYREAPYVEIWPQENWMRWVPVLAMPVASALFVAGLMAPGTLSVGFGRRNFDPRRPGVVSVTRHPVIWALLIWSVAHMVPNGDAASLILFGLLTALALTGPKSLDHKARARLGAGEWKRLAKNTSNGPLAAVFAGKTRLDWRGIGWGPVLGGLALYAAFFTLHETVIGVSPL